jgi:hypothetical protein
MYALFAACNALSPTRLDDNIANISKERFNEQYGKISRGGLVYIFLTYKSFADFGKQAGGSQCL